LKNEKKNPKRKTNGRANKAEGKKRQKCPGGRARETEGDTSAATNVGVGLRNGKGRTNSNEEPATTRLRMVKKAGAVHPG